MNFNYEFLIPKNTLQSVPYREILPLSYGVITSLPISIPSGHAGKAHLFLEYQGTQLYPINPGSNYHGDDTTIPIQDRLFMSTPPYELVAVGWNTDAEWDHRFLININVMLPDQIGMGSGTQTSQDLIDIIGKVFQG